MITFLRKNLIASIILTFLRIFIGIQWLQAALGKLLSSETFDTSDLITNALNSSVYPWFTGFLHLTTDGGQNTALFDFIIPWGQLFVGLALIWGVFTTLAAYAGLLMNVSFVLAGVVSENPTFIIIQLFIILAGFNAAKFGFDYWLVPFFQEKLTQVYRTISNVLNKKAA